MRKFNIELNKGKLEIEKIRLTQLQAQLNTLQEKVREVFQRIETKNAEIKDLETAIRVNSQVS